MSRTTRRRFVKTSAAIAGALWIPPWFSRSQLRAAESKKTNIQIEHVSTRYEEFVFRTPLKFALSVVDRQTLLTATCTVRTASGRTATGFGTLPLNYTFTFPSKKLSQEARLGAMKALGEEIAKVT